MRALAVAFEMAVVLLLLCVEEEGEAAVDHEGSEVDGAEREDQRIKKQPDQWIVLLYSMSHLMKLKKKTHFDQAKRFTSERESACVLLMCQTRFGVSFFSFSFFYIVSAAAAAAKSSGHHAKRA